MTIDDYIQAHSEKEPDYLAEINRRTNVKMINPRMCSGYLQGRVLSMLSKMIKPGRILEIGTFTGYSALCLAEGLTESGKLHTIEIDDELEDFILENFALSPLSEKIKIHIGKALEIIPHIDEKFDLVFIDADKKEYWDYYEIVLPKVNKNGFILVDNTLWDGKVLNKPDENDKQTIEIIRFNKLLAEDTRVEKVILAVRDGLTIIRKR